MNRASRSLLVVAALLLAAACGGARPGEGNGEDSPRARFNLIGYEELQQYGHFSNLHDLVASLRPRWLQSQGPDTFMGQAGEVQVHMDGNRLGGVAVLKSLAVPGVTSIRWVSPIDAGARYGLDHSHGAIIISTRPVH